MHRRKRYTSSLIVNFVSVILRTILPASGDLSCDAAAEGGGSREILVRERQKIRECLSADPYIHRARRFIVVIIMSTGRYREVFLAVVFRVSSLRDL